MIPFRIAALAMLGFVTLAGTRVDEPERLPAGHPDRGLPNPSYDWRPYHAARDHVLNRIARSIWLVKVTPAEVAGALTQEHASDESFFQPGWYFAKRKGEARDERWFGGDGRQLVREGFADDERDAFLATLTELDERVVQELHARPDLAVLFQNDLLRLMRRLEETKRNPELLAPLRDAVHRVALPSTAFDTLQDPLIAHAPPSLRLDTRRATEVQRRSTRLFDAARIFAWTRVFLETPEEAPSVLDLLAREDREAPLGLHSVMFQGAVAIDASGDVRATPITLEVRTKTFTNEQPLSFENPTSTKDGIDFAVAILRREGLRTGKDVYRVIDPDDQVMFRDYGTLKHTTLRAQCTLCHRRTNTPETALAGFSTLRSSAMAHPVDNALERLHQARREVAEWIATWNTPRDE